MQVENYAENIKKSLYPTLFVGQSTTAGIYALPAYIDSQTITIAPKYIGPPLLEGPIPVEMDVCLLVYKSNFLCI